MSMLKLARTGFYTWVKVVTLKITQKNMTDFDASVTDMNSTDRLSTSIVMLQSQANSTEQYR